MTKTTKRLPRILKEPTGWVIIVLMVGFLYVQWPTHVREKPQPNYVTQQITPQLSVTWEEAPTVSNIDELEVWTLNRKGMVFMVQKSQLKQPFEQWVPTMAEQDRKTVGGAVQDPLELTENTASYAFFDAENRIQEHRIYLKNNEWVKVSMLYKPSMETRVARAALFLNQINWQPEL
jgi:hypothetical protein